jgi:hypothetical protein
VKPELKINWASHDAAKYACENWHYSKCLPVGKLVKVGAWEDGKFIGVVIFGRGANNNMLKPFGLEQDDGCELVRIALTKHVTPVSKIMAFAIRFLKKSQAGLQLIVSYADPEQGHHGGIYQACNWIYTGPSDKAVKVFYKGKWSHKKTVDDAGVDQTNLPKKIVQGKHRYLMALDKMMDAKIQPLAKPYPKRVKQAMTGDQPEQRRCNTDPPAPLNAENKPFAEVKNGNEKTKT